MKRTAGIYNAYDLLARHEFWSASQIEVSGTVRGVVPSNSPKARSYWVPSRPLAPSWHRWRATWLVLTGRADALHWPGQEY